VSDSTEVYGDGMSKAEEGRVMVRVRVRGKGIKNIRVGKQSVEGGSQKDGNEVVKVVG